MIKQEADQGFQKVWDMFAEADKRWKKMEKQFQQTDAKIDALTGKWGRFVEGLVAPAAERLFKKKGIQVMRIYPRAKARLNGSTLEIDILAVGPEHAILIEVKSTLSVDDVKEHVQNLPKFKMFFPEYADRKLLGAVAGIVIEEGVDRYAYQQGLFVIGQSGKSVRILNDDKFQPKEW